MAFPSTPLDIRTELQLDGVWTDVSADVYVRDAKEIDHGRRDMGARTDPGHLTLTFNNKDGKYSTRNPMSPLWGKIGPNTPVRVSVPGSTNYLELTGADDSYVSTPDTAALDITGDIDLRAEAAINWYDPTASQVLIQKWDATGNQRSYVLRLFDQQLRLSWSTTGSNNLSASRPLPALPERAAVRATLDVDNGSGGYTARLYWAQTIAGPWTQIGEDIVGSSTTSIFAGTAPLQVGGSDPTTTPPRSPFAGKGYLFEVRSGIGGSLVAAPDFTAQPLGAAGFTDSAGRVWSYSGTAHITDRAYRIVGEISEWPKEWQPDGSDVWSPVEASGVLRRYDQGTRPLHSTLRRRIPSGSPIAYWPFEEDREASRAYSPIAGVNPASVTGVEWAALDTLPSSRALPKLTNAATLSAIVPEHDPAGEWQVEFVYNADDKAPSSLAEIVSISTTGTVRRWSLQMRNGAAWVFGYNSSGTAIVDAGIGIGGDVFHGWVRLRFRARDNGSGSIEWRIAWQDVGGDAGGVAPQTVTGTTGRVTAITANWGAATEGWGFGHLSVLPDADSTLYTGSDRAYTGETAWERMRRLASEEGIPMARIPGELTPERVGPQSPETLLELLHQAAEADGGLLLEDRERLGLIYRERSSMYTQEPALVLDATLPGLGADLRPSERADFVRNDITIKRTGGSEGRAFLAEGRLSVNPPPNGIGLYDHAPELSLADDTQTEPIAYWQLHLRTFDGARYPSVSVMLHKPGAQDLIPQVLALREGDLIRVKNLPGYIEWGDLDLIVEGYKETLDLYEWLITFNCSPGGPWNLAVADHPVYGKADTDGSELATAATTTSTGLDVRATAGRPWTASAQESPWDIQFGGEVATVTAVGRQIAVNPFFDTDTTGWAGSGSTIAWSTAVVHWRERARASLLVTPDGVTATGGANQSPRTPVGSVTPGGQYTVSCWVYHPAGWADMRPIVDWFDASNVYLSTPGSTAVSVPAGAWTYMEATYTAPANASRAAPRIRHGSTPPASAFYYVWALRMVGTQSAYADSFTRSVTGGWGTADSGQAWAIPGGSASERTVDGTRGVVTMPSSISTVRFQTLATGVQDCEVRCRMQAPQVSTGASLVPAVLFRYVNTSTYYRARLHFATGGGLFLSSTVGTTQLEGSALSIPYTYSAGAEFEVRARVDGHRIRMKAWPVAAAEPTAWQLDSTVTSGTIAEGAVGLTCSGFAGNTNASPAIRFDNFEVVGVQRLTVERSANGVVKAHPIATSLRLATPAITSL